MTCALCRQRPADLVRVAGVDLCPSCQAHDPTAALQAQGFAAEWNTSLQRFSAGIGIPGRADGFVLQCVPQRWHHTLAKWVSQEVEVGESTFDDAVFVRTSDADEAARLLASEGVQSALLLLLSGLRAGELAGNEVRLDGPTLTVGIRPLDGLSEATLSSLQVATAVLALHLRALSA